VSSDDSSFSWQDAEKDLVPGVDTSVPVSARILNYWLGGKDYYPVDKAAGDQYAQLFPGIFVSARASHYFLARVVRFLAGDVGVRQFLDIGTGLPSHDNTHEIAQRVAPESRVVYVDNDPLVLAHARALLTSKSTGGTDYIDADLNDPDEIIRIAREKLDFCQPVAIMLMGTLGHIGNPAEDDDGVARSIVDRLKEALPSCGYLAIRGALEDPEFSAAQEVYNQTGAAPYHLRRADQIIRFFDGLELVEPGVVPIPEWRPDHSPFGNGTEVPVLGGVGRKP